MGFSTPLFPEQASTMAPRVDALYFFLVAVSVFFSVLIASLILYFTVRYRRHGEHQIGAPIEGNLALEVLWCVIPLGISIIVFVWGASIYFSMATPPAGALNIYVVAKQWMWKFQHIDGQSEINELHVPVGRPVRLTMTSEDVIHDLFVPAFRVKTDVIPGRYSTLWFEVTQPGRYRLFCAEYCGTQHSHMTGQVVAMEPAEYAAWLGGGPATASLADLGSQVFQAQNCFTCHRAGAGALGPPLDGIFGQPRELATGEVMIADEDYLREAILNPAAKLLRGFKPLMTPYQGRVTDDQVIQLIEYIKSLRPVPATQPAGDAAPAR
jgi:cytochrome c oxidase subunit 2